MEPGELAFAELMLQTDLGAIEQAILDGIAASQGGGFLRTTLRAVEDLGQPVPNPGEIQRLGWWARRRRRRVERMMKQFGHGACNVYCANKAKPVQELVLELAKHFVGAVALHIGVRTDNVEFGAAVAVAVFYLRTGMDHSCAC